MASEKNCCMAEYETVPDKASIQAVVEFMDNTLETLEVPVKVAGKAQIILDEIYSNIVYYSKASYVKITVIYGDDILKMIFEDDGLQYDPTSADNPDLTIPVSEREPGGLGILMVRKLSKNLIYQYMNGKNILKIVL